MQQGEFLTCLIRTRLCCANTAIFLQHILCLEKPLQLATSNSINGPDHFQALTTRIAVQLLATCFTLPLESERSSRSPVSYRSRSFPIGLSSDPRLISSLRLHTQFRNSPALGHNARNSSPALAWLNARSEPSREECLAEDISRRRRIEQLNKRQHPGKEPNRRHALSNDSLDMVEENNGIATSTSLRRRNRSSTGVTRSPGAPCKWRKVERIYAPPNRVASPPTGPNSQISGTRGARPIWRNNRGNEIGSHRLSFEPVLRSEDHPVFIQPVKEHIVRRWRALKSSPKTVPSTVRSDKISVRSRRKRNRTSDLSSSELSLGTSGPSTASSMGNAGPVRLSAVLDLAAGPESVRQSPFLLTTEPSNAHPSVAITSANSSLPANDLTRTLADDDAPSYLSTY